MLNRLSPSQRTLDASLRSPELHSETTSKKDMCVYVYIYIYIYIYIYTHTLYMSTQIITLHSKCLENHALS